MKSFGVFLVALTLMAGTTVAKPPLREVKEIDDALFWGVLAYEVSEICPSIDARTVKGVAALWSLGRKAEKLGYTREEIKAYTKSPEEKARMRARGEAYLATQGVTYDDPETFCTFGLAEIERNSAIGVLLKAK